MMINHTVHIPVEMDLNTMFRCAIVQIRWLMGNELEPPSPTMMMIIDMS